MTVVVVALLIVLVPLAARTLVPTSRETAAPGAREALPSSGPALVRFTPPAGWTLTTLGGDLTSPVVYQDGPASLAAAVSPGVADVDLFVRRRLRAVENDGLTARPAGDVRTATGVTGRRFTLAGRRSGELVVLARRPVAVVLVLTTDPAHPVDLDPVIASVGGR